MEAFFIFWVNCPFNAQCFKTAVLNSSPDAFYMYLCYLQRYVSSYLKLLCTTEFSSVCRVFKMNALCQVNMLRGYGALGPSSVHGA